MAVEFARRATRQPNATYRAFATLTASLGVSARAQAEAAAAELIQRKPEYTGRARARSSSSATIPHSSTGSSPDCASPVFQGVNYAAVGASVTAAAKVRLALAGTRALQPL